MTPIAISKPDWNVFIGQAKSLNWEPTKDIGKLGLKLSDIETYVARCTPDSDLDSIMSPGYAHVHLTFMGSPNEQEMLELQTYSGITISLLKLNTYIFTASLRTWYHYVLDSRLTVAGELRQFFMATKLRVFHGREFALR